MFRKLATLLAIVTIALSAAPSADAQTFQSTSTKYRERFPVFFGTSGTVKLSARLLYGPDGKTELVATTGDIDSTTPGAGNLTGLLITAADGRGRLVYTNLLVNSNGTGRMTKTFTGFVPGQPFFLQGIVLKTVNGRLGIYYVNVNARVQRRPDLYVHDVVLPARVPVFTPVQITALVSEVNGQIGARTDCVMYVNDVEKDRAPGIWVDSGDTVSCAFTHTFFATGTGTVKVAAEQVKPSDWDNANNAASTPVEVYTPEYDGFGANGIIFELNRVGTKDYGRFVNSTVTGGQDFVFETLTTAVGDAFEYAGLKIGVPPVMPTRVTISASDATNTWSVAKDLTQCETLDVGSSGGRVYWVYVLGCNGSIWVQAGSNAGSVTYTSINWTRNFNIIKGVVVPLAPVQVIENRTEVVAPLTFAGPTWNLDVAVDVAGVTYTGPISLDVTTPFDLGEVTTVCHSQPNLVYCTDSGWRQKGTLGTFIKSLTPPLPPPPAQPGGAGGPQP